MKQKQKTKKLIALMLCVLMALSCLAVLAGCGGNGESAGSGAETAKDQTEQKQETQQATVEDVSLEGDWCFEDGSLAFTFGKDGVFKANSCPLGSFGDDSYYEEFFSKKHKYTVSKDGLITLKTSDKKIEIKKADDFESAKKERSYYISGDSMALRGYVYYKKGGPSLEEFSKWSKEETLADTAWKEETSNEIETATRNMIFDASGEYNFIIDSKREKGQIYGFENGKYSITSKDILDFNMTQSELFYDDGEKIDTIIGMSGIEKSTDIADFYKATLDPSRFSYFMIGDILFLFGGRFERTDMTEALENYENMHNKIFPPKEMSPEEAALVGDWCYEDGSVALTLGEDGIVHDVSSEHHFFDGEEWVLTGDNELWIKGEKYASIGNGDVIVFPEVPSGYEGHLPLYKAGGASLSALAKEKSDSIVGIWEGNRETLIFGRNGSYNSKGIKTPRIQVEDARGSYALKPDYTLHIDSEDYYKERHINYERVSSIVDYYKKMKNIDSDSENQYYYFDGDLLLLGENSYRKK